MRSSESEAHDKEEVVARLPDGLVGVAPFAGAGDESVGGGDVADAAEVFTEAAPDFLAFFSNQAACPDAAW